jgi:hypothetical protein
MDLMSPNGAKASRKSDSFKVGAQFTCTVIESVREVQIIQMKSSFSRGIINLQTGVKVKLLLLLLLGGEISSELTRSALFLLRLNPQRATIQNVGFGLKNTHSVKYER